MFERKRIGQWKSRHVTDRMQQQERKEKNKIILHHRQDREPRAQETQHGHDPLRSEKAIRHHSHKEGRNHTGDRRRRVRKRYLRSGEPLRAHISAER